jgi:hypothetical protein
MTKDLKNDLLEVFIKHKIINEYTLRNEQIRDRYLELKEIPKLKKKEVIKKLCDEFYLSDKSIEAIIYRKEV